VHLEHGLDALMQFVAVRPTQQIACPAQRFGEALGVDRFGQVIQGVQPKGLAVRG
jgi:hypothetical protein